MGILHDRFVRRTRDRLREYAQEQGVEGDRLKKLMELADTKAIDKAVTDAGVRKPVSGFNKVGGLGDGQLLKAIRDWLSSDEGKAFIQFLFQLLISLV